MRIAIALDVIAPESRHSSPAVILIHPRHPVLQKSCVFVTACLFLHLRGLEDVGGYTAVPGKAPALERTTVPRSREM